MLDKYEELYVCYEQVKEQNDLLKAQYESLPQPTDKQAVMVLLDQKAKAADEVAKNTDK